MNNQPILIIATFNQEFFKSPSLSFEFDPIYIDLIISSLSFEKFTVK